MLYISLQIFQVQLRLSLMAGEDALPSASTVDLLAVAAEQQRHMLCQTQVAMSQLLCIWRISMPIMMPAAGSLLAVMTCHGHDSYRLI